MNIKKLLSAGIISSVMLMSAFSPAIVSAGEADNGVSEKLEIRGDISGNGRIDLYDAIEIAKVLLGKRNITDEEIKIADFNSDGKINLYDVIDIAKYVLSLTTDREVSVKPVYYTHIFDHVKNIDDLRKHYTDTGNRIDLIMYGYPDYNYFEDTLRLISEGRNADFEEVKKDINSHCEEGKSFTYEVLDAILSWRDMPIIEGETVGIEYTAYEGMPWTVCEVLVSEVLNFTPDYVFNKGDRVKIAMPGGYMSVREYIELEPDSKLFSGLTEKEINSSVIYEDGSNQKEPKIGDVFTYILNPSDEIPNFPVEGCTARYCFNDAAQFTRNGNVFTCCNSNLSDMYFTAGQVSMFDFDNVFKDTASGRSIGIKCTSFLLSGSFDCYGTSADGRIEYLGACFTDDGFYPFLDENDYSITWTDYGAVIEYRFDYLVDIFKTEEFLFP